MAISTQTTGTEDTHGIATDAPVLMTLEQKFFFDLRGWILPARRTLRNGH